MEILELNSMEASTHHNNINKISKSIGFGSNSNEKVSPYTDSVLRLLVSDAEKRLKKLESYYQHTYKNYTEARSDRYWYYKEAHRCMYRMSRLSYHISYYNDQQKKLRNSLEKLKKPQTMHGCIKRPNQCKEISMLHRCKSLVQENKKLRQIIRERPQQNLEKNETIHYEKGNWEFNYNPKRITNKGIDAMLKRVRDAQKLTDEAIANGELMNKSTSEESFKRYIEKGIKLIDKYTKRLEKERESEARNDKYYEEKVKHLEKKCEWICGKWDDEKKYIVWLKKIHDGS